MKEQATIILDLKLTNTKLENSIQQLKDENEQMLRQVYINFYLKKKYIFYGYKTYLCNYYVKQQPTNILLAD